MLSILRKVRPWSLILASVGLAASIAFLYFTIRTPRIPQRTLRIGFEQVPPVQIRTPKGFSGLAVETVNEAAKRAGVSLQWVETGTSSEEALRRGLVDLWPIMVDLPERRKHVHITKPWLYTGHTLMLPAEKEPPGREFAGRIALIKLPIHARLVREEFPNAQLVQLGQAGEVLKEVCRGTVFAGFLDDRAGLAALRERPAECATMRLRVHSLPRLTFPLGVGSTFEAAGAADRIRDKIGDLFRDGTLAVTMAKYSYFGIDAAWGTYALMAADERTRFVAWVIGGLGIALATTAWQAASLHQRKKSEAALRESEERFRRVFEEGPLGLALVGKDYRFEKVNSALCSMVAYDEAELVQMSFVDITHPDDVRADVDLAGRLFKREIPFYRIQKRYVKKTGEIIWINLTASMILGPDGEALHGLAMVEDITDIKRTQEEAFFRQKLESLGTLAGGIAHDFNNLLGAVQAQAELGLAELSAGSSGKEELKAICEVAMRGSEIVRQLMMYAGTESTAVELVDTSEIVDEMLALLKVSVTKRALIRADLDQDLPPIRASAAQIRQIVMNLITNASDAIEGRDGLISVITRRVTVNRDPATISSQTLATGEYVQLEVSDNGCGISPEMRAKVFDPFFSTKSAGRGLGLAVVQGIVRSLGGTVHLTSELEKGTTFQILLPSPETTGGASSFVIPSDKSAVQTQICSLLVVEDEEYLRQGMVKMLRKTGFQVFEAADGTSAIDLLRASGTKIDVILLDMTLPGLSSHEIVGEAINIKPDIRVILTSAYSRETIEASVSAPQIRSFIRKPFQFEDLLKTLRNTLA